MVTNLEMHMKHTHGMKLAPVSGLVDSNLHIDDDGVHLTPSGYRLFMDKVYTRVIDMWLAPLYHNTPGN